MYKRLLMVIVFGSLACGSVLGQEPGVVSGTMRPDNPAKLDTRPATNFQLKGVLISNSNRTALVNGQLFQEGDHMGGAEILTIDQGGVRVLIGARKFTVDVGGTFAGGQSSSDVTMISHKPTPQSQNQEQRAAVRSAPLQDRNVARLGAHLQHAVKPGETLSGIALQYLRDGVTMNQMMIALFQANPQAFSNNINALRQGAILRIPDENNLRRQTPETATTEVARQTKAWQADYEQHALLASTHTNMMASSNELIN